MFRYFKYKLYCLRILIALFFILLNLCAIGQNITEKTKLDKIFQLTEFVYWPFEQDSSYSPNEFTISVLGPDDFGNSFDMYFEGKKIKNKPVKIYNIDKNGPFIGCQILYIADTTGVQLDRIISDIKDKPILIVSYYNGFAHKGVHINFYDIKSSTPFEVNLKRILESHLMVSHLLLRIVKVIPDENDP